MGAVKETKNYDKFEMTLFNRDVKNITNLKKSFEQYGWIDAYPMHVVPNGGKVLKIKAGHHRFTAAQELGLPVKYVVCHDEASIFEMEKSTTAWKLKDYLTAYIRSGKKQYMIVKQFHDSTGIGLSLCISLLSGTYLKSSKAVEQFKDGKFKILALEHAQTIGDLIRYCRDIGIDFATNSKFVTALSKICAVNGVDLRQLRLKLKSHRNTLEKQATVKMYQDEIERIYNFHARNGNKMNLSFLADIAS